MSFFSSSLSSTFAVFVASSSVSLPKASISFCSSSSNVTSSGVFSFSSSDDENSYFFLRYLLASGFPGCLGVGSFDDVGLLFLIDEDLLYSFSVNLEFLGFAGFLLHSDEKWSASFFVEPAISSLHFFFLDSWSFL